MATEFDTPGAPKIIALPQPPMGGKCFVVREKGLFVLERGPGTLRTIACTHAGAGALEAIDGIPDARGFFLGESWSAPEMPPGIMERMKAGDPRLPQDEAYMTDPYWTRNGRAFYSANPVVMGSWMLDAGFQHGLTLRVQGGHEAAMAIASVVWVPFRAHRGQVRGAPLGAPVAERD